MLDSSRSQVKYACCSITVAHSHAPAIGEDTRNFGSASDTVTEDFDVTSRDLPHPQFRIHCGGKQDVG